MKFDEDSDGAIYDVEWAELLGVDEMPLAVSTQLDKSEGKSKLWACFCLW